MMAELNQQQLQIFTMHNFIYKSVLWAICNTSKSTYTTECNIGLDTLLISLVKIAMEYQWKTIEIPVNFMIPLEYHCFSHWNLTFKWYSNGIPMEIDSDER